MFEVVDITSETLFKIMSLIYSTRKKVTRTSTLEHRYLLLQIAQISTQARSKLLEMCCKHHSVPNVFIVTSSASSKIEENDEEEEEEEEDLPVATATALTSQEQRAYPKSKTGFVGMLNLGNICYMNATNQQLFMIRNFREGILKSRSKKGTDESSVLYQLQRMFGYLRDGELQFYNPVRFCKVLKDWDGNSVNVAVQDDANLYFTKLMQNLEGNLEGTRSNPIRTNLSGLYVFCSSVKVSLTHSHNFGTQVRNGNVRKKQDYGKDDLQNM